MYRFQQQRDPLLTKLEEKGIYFTGAQGFFKPEWKRNLGLAFDAQPQMVTNPNAAIPSLLTTFIDPQQLEILLAKFAATEIFDEVQKGTWTDTVGMFPVVEHTAEVASYGDYSQNGSAEINPSFPNREAYRYQTILGYGDLELDTAALAKVNVADGKRRSAILGLNRFQNQTYFFGVKGLQNYGILNDPNLLPAIAPGIKGYNSATGISWYNGNIIAATANEIFNDLQSLVTQVIRQSSGNVDKKSKFIFAMSPESDNALATTNSYGLSVQDMLNKNYPNHRVVSAVQYDNYSAQNPDGSAVGAIVQCIVDDVLGQKTGWVAYSSKLRTGPVITELSSWRQKMSQSTFGFICRQPFAIATMIGV